MLASISRAPDRVSCYSAAMTDSEAFSAEEIERYARHIVLPEIGGAGQQALKRARVLVIGAGGLGSPVLAYLAAAGVGTLGIADDDGVSLSNLQRQVIHDSGTVGAEKTESAARAIARINPHVICRRYQERLDAATTGDILSGFDLLVDGSDNFDTRYMAADAAERAEVPLVTGAVGRFDGSVTVLKPYAFDGDGRQNPRYRDLYPAPPPPGLVPSCAEAGIVGPVTGVIGTLMAMEVIKLITGAGEPLVGRLLLYDGLSARFETIAYARKA
ncbi:UNVERIFIED_ORG: molybdopterin/thiamine biosynthesis adenylyltransferase [Martelella mediterranea]